MYPEASDLRRLEKETLLCISQVGEFGRLGALQAQANAFVNSINESRGPINVNLGFTMDIRLRADRREKLVRRRIDIGALVEVASDHEAITNASYSLVICKWADPVTSPVLRKLHFDYEPLALRNKSEPKPTVHMQVCGQFSSHHFKAGYTEKKLGALYPGFEKPRIPAPPTSIGLMLNWMLVEFQSDLAAPIILKNPRWRALISEAERLLLRPYYDSAAAFLKSAGQRKKRFLQNYLYEMVVD
jgi:hypothetical protein